MKTLIVSLLLVVVCGGAVAWYRHDAVAKLPALRTAQVERGDLQFAVDATGTVEPEEVVDVGAQVAGKINSLGADPRNPEDSIDYGSPVDVGTVLARVDDSLYQSEVEQAQAQVDSARAISTSMAAQVLDAQANIERAQKDLQQMQAKLYKAKRDWARSESLEKSSPGAITDSELDLAKTTYEGADAAVGVGMAAISQAKAQLSVAQAAVVKAGADLSNAQATLNRAKTNLGYCTIKSPVKGVIIDRRINVGQTVVSSFNSPSLFLIAKDLKRLEVWASVNEADIGNIHSGQNVQFTVDTFPGETFQGAVAPDQPRLNASMNQNVVTYTVVVTTDNSNGRLLPYLTADLEFEVSRHNNVLIVPNSALRWHPSPARRAAAGLDSTPEGNEDASATAKSNKDADRPGGEGTVWIVENDRLRPVKVRKGLSDGARTEVTGDGLEAGVTVAVGEALAAGEGVASDPFLPKVFGGGKSGQK